MRTRHTCAVAAGAFTFLTSAYASAATLRVSNGTAACPGASFTTIQSAIDAAAPNDTVDVCPGTYAEQITIGAGKDGVIVRSTSKHAATIAAPATMADPGDIVRVHAAKDVTVEGFAIAGPLPNALFCSVFQRTGVRVDGAGSAVIRGNHITDIRSADPSLRGCQNGVPIMVGYKPEGETGAALIEDNTIEAYQKTGILVDNAGSHAVVVRNRVLGDGPSPTIAQNGIQVSYGADAFVADNWVAGQIYAPSPLSSGILLLLPGHVAAVGNEVRDADYGIIMLDATDPEIRRNKVAACTADGIVLDEYATGTTGAMVVDNESHDNGVDGLLVTVSSKGNRIVHNRMFGDRGFDAEDDSTGSGTAGTGNRWHHDRCKTDNHGGLLCEKDDDD